MKFTNDHIYVATYLGRMIIRRFDMKYFGQGRSPGSILGEIILDKHLYGLAAHVFKLCVKSLSSAWNMETHFGDQKRTSSGSIYR